MPPLHANSSFETQNNTPATIEEVWHRASVLCEKMASLLEEEYGFPMGPPVALYSKSAFYKAADQLEADVTVTRAWVVCHPEYEAAVHIYTESGVCDTLTGGFKPLAHTMKEHLAIEQPSGKLTSNYGPLTLEQQVSLLKDAEATVEIIRTEGVFDASKQQNMHTTERHFDWKTCTYRSH